MSGYPSWQSFLVGAMGVVPFHSASLKAREPGLLVEPVVLKFAVLRIVGPVEAVYLILPAVLALAMKVAMLAVSGKPAHADPAATQFAPFTIAVTWSCVFATSRGFVRMDTSESF